MINGGMMSSNRDDWRTPIDLFRQLDAVFNFDLDVAASEDNALCKHFYTKDESAFAQSWSCESAWCNPPYGRNKGEWMAKCEDEAWKGSVVVALVPARTDTAVWRHNIFGSADAICFLYGRLKFDDGKGSAPFPSALVVWGRGMSKKEINQLAHLGKWVIP